MSENPGTLYGYYREQSLLPTHASFSSEEQLGAYDRMRRTVFETKLMLPPRLFERARVLEFGPDSGENSLVFARWGAKLTLAEPNERAVAQIREYFKHFQLEDQVEHIASADVLEFTSDRRFHVVDAEGFIYTVDLDAWLASFARVVAPSGHFIISYYERYGAFFELVLKALHVSAIAILNAPAEDVAERLYRAKWDTIPHSRKFLSWVMDVLRNPFVTTQHFISARDLCTRAASHGFRLYSSWPIYRDPLAIYWHKKALNEQEDAARNDEHIIRSTLSFMSGSRFYLTGSLAEAKELTARADGLLESVDAMARGSLDASAAAAQQAQVFAQAVEQVGAIEDAGARLSFMRLLQVVRSCCERIANKDIDGLAALTSRDADFLAMWGMPAHFAVFERTE